jgi:hypothetical protein
LMLAQMTDDLVFASSDGEVGWVVDEHAGKNDK